MPNERFIIVKLIEKVELKLLIGQISCNIQDLRAMLTNRILYNNNARPSFNYFFFLHIGSDVFLLFSGYLVAIII